MFVVPHSDITRYVPSVIYLGYTTLCPALVCPAVFSRKLLSWHVMYFTLLYQQNFDCLKSSKEIETIDDGSGAKWWRNDICDGWEMKNMRPTHLGIKLLSMCGCDVPLSAWSACLPETLHFTGVLMIHTPCSVHH